MTSHIKFSRLSVSGLQSRQLCPTIFDSCAREDGNESTWYVRGRQKAIDQTTLAADLAAIVEKHKQKGPK